MTSENTEQAAPKKRGRPPKDTVVGNLERRFGIKPGEQVPLHIANQITREQNARSRDMTKEAVDAAAEAIEGALSSAAEKPRSGRRTRKNLRAPVEPPEQE